CVLPLVPGYLSYVTGLTGADLAEQVEDGRPAGAGTASGVATGGVAASGAAGGEIAGGGVAVAAPPVARPRRAYRTGRVLTGSLLFVLGFSLVFVSYGTLIGWLGDVFLAHGAVISRVAGVLVILLGLAFL